MGNDKPPPSSGLQTFPDVSGLLRHRRVLEVLVGNRGREVTIRELAMESHVPYATTWRLVEALMAMGALRSRRVGASRLVSLNPSSPILPKLRRLATLRLEPHREAALRFARLASRDPKVRRVVLFGSASRGAAGPQSDVDVAVVLDRRTEEVMDEIYGVAAEVQDKTGLKVVPVGLIPRELRADTRFAQDVRSGEVLYDRS
ncbi:MAG: nucleotidyltransferase domain-containing protein [Thermoplasmata archaeon]